MTLGEKIEFHRKKLGLTKVKLAALLGLNNSSTITQWAKDKWPPNPENLVKLAEIFKLPVTQLMGEEGVSPAEMLAQKHSVLYKRAGKLNITEGVREGGAYSHQEADFTSPQSAKHIVKKEAVTESSFDLPLYSNDGYLPFLIESFDEGLTFALKAGSDKVYSQAKEGDYIIITLTGKVRSGKTALVKIGNKYSIKQVFYGKGAATLKDGKKKTVLPKSKFEIAGQVLAFISLP